MERISVGPSGSTALASPSRFGRTNPPPRRRSEATAARSTAPHGCGATYAQRQRPERVPQLPLWKALIESAARWGELTATTWLDLDVDQLSLTLRGEHTKAARTRVIPVSAALAEELLALRAVHQRVRMRLVRPGDRIFLSPDGSDWAAYTTNARRLLRRVMDRAGIARVDAVGRTVDIHGLRTSSLTRLSRRGVPLSVAQRIAGHASPVITSKHYVHTELEDLRVAVEGGRGVRRGRGATG